MQLYTLSDSKRVALYVNLFHVNLLGGFFWGFFDSHYNFRDQWPHLLFIKFHPPSKVAFVVGESCVKRRVNGGNVLNIS